MIVTDRSIFYGARPIIFVVVNINPESNSTISGKSRPECRLMPHGSSCSELLSSRKAFFGMQPAADRHDSFLTSTTALTMSAELLLLPFFQLP